MRTRRSIPLFIRFARLVEVRSPNQCWPWLGAVSGSGYGHISDGSGTVVSAHRVAYMLHYFHDPGDGDVTHDCDNKRCVNPYHLRLGDQSSNGREFVDRLAGAKWWGARTKIGPEEARVIKAEYDAGGVSMAALAHKYGVSTMPIFSIVHDQRLVDRR